MLNIYITLGYLIDEVLQIVYGMKLFPYKTDDVRKNTILLFITRVIVKIIFLPISKYFMIKLPTFLVVQFLIYNYFYKAKISHKLLAVVSYCLYGFIGEIFVGLMGIYVFHMNYADIMDFPIYTILSVILIYSVMAILCGLTVMLVHKYTDSSSLNMEYLTVAISIFLFILGVNLYFIALYIYQYKNIPFIALAVTTFTFSIIAFFFLYKHTKLQRKRAAESAFIEHQTMLQQQHYEDLKQKYTDIRKLQHDFKNHLQTIQSLYLTNSNDKLSKYISELTESIQKTNNITFCSNAAADAVLYNKLQYAQKCHIDIQINSVNISNISVSDMDLCSIISNLLDNAIENCEKEAANKYITFNIYRKNCYLVFDCRNFCTSYNPNTDKSDKKLHGLGMKIIKSISDKYNGNDYHVLKDNEFVHIVNINI